MGIDDGMRDGPPFHPLGEGVGSTLSVTFCEQDGGFEAAPGRNNLS